MEKLGITHESGIGITGVKGMLEGRGSDLTIAYMGELDSVLVRAHPDADSETGAAHACGHNAQIANLIALAYGLVESGVMDGLHGNIALMAVPAEEYVEVAYRLSLKDEGKLEFLGGKPEMVRLGAFDDVHLAFMTHQATRKEEEGAFGVGGANNGCIVKYIRYEGVASHAGGAPHNGVNALKAANLGLAAVDAIRETFKDDDHIRVHPIITKGGELVNVVPSDVRIETFVRGASTEAMIEAAKRVDRCLKAGAMAVGCKVHIRTLPGYLPKRLSNEFVEVYKQNVVEFAGQEEWSEPSFGAGSTDVGDLSHIMPAIEARASGAAGTGHGADYRIADEDRAYIAPAKLAAMTLIDLLSGNAETARKVIGQYSPPMSKESYLEFMRNIDNQESWDGLSA
jgi:amidohydrolase